MSQSSGMIAVNTKIWSQCRAKLKCRQYWSFEFSRSKSLLMECTECSLSGWRRDNIFNFWETDFFIEKINNSPRTIFLQLHFWQCLRVNETSELPFMLKSSLVGAIVNDILEDSKNSFLIPHKTGICTVYLFRTFSWMWCALAPESSPPGWEFKSHMVLCLVDSWYMMCAVDLYFE